MKINSLLDEALGELTAGDKSWTMSLDLEELRDLAVRLKQVKSNLKKHKKTLLARNPTLLQKIEDFEIKIQKKIADLKKLEVLDLECSDFISHMQQAGKMLLRGTRSTDITAFEAHSVIDRKPLDSKKVLSGLFDQALIDYGFRALRSNSIFTTSNLPFAKSFGNVYIIFPKNGFDWTSTMVEDAVLDYWNMIDRTAMNQLTLDLYNWGIANVDNWTETRWGFINLGDQERLQLLHNNFANGNPLNMPERFNVSVEDFVNSKDVWFKFRPYRNNLTRAIKSGREVLIRGEYWAFKRTDWYGIITNKYFPKKSK